MDMLAQEDSWVSVGGMNKVGTSADVLNQGLSLGPRRTKMKEITKVTNLMRVPGGGLREGPKYSRGPAVSRARWRWRADSDVISL
jgi:hypothetical protein